MLIPSCLYITMDDLGWFCGTDDRPAGGSSRSGMPRRHCAEDYAAVNELGRRLNMKINCAFVLGEWDPDNRLKRIPYLSKYADTFGIILSRDMTFCATQSLYKRFAAVREKMGFGQWISARFRNRRGLGSIFTSAQKRNLRAGQAAM